MNAKKNIYLIISIISLFSNVLLFSQIRVGMDVSGSFDISYPSVLDQDSEDYDADSGIIIGYDYMVQKQDKLSLGVGAEYMMQRGVEDFSEGKAAFHSIYGFGKYLIDDKMYGLARLGYNMHTGDDDYTDTGELGGTIKLSGGMMYSIGAGFSLTPNVNLEASHSLHAGEVNWSGDVITEYFGGDLGYKLKYTRFNIGVVYTP